MEDPTWLSTPLAIYDYHFQNSCGDKIDSSFEAYIEEKIRNTTDAIPFVTEATLPYIPDGNLVCVQGMLQDMFDSELFMSSYRCKGEDGSETPLRSTFYRDVEYLKADITLDEKSVKLATRHSFFITPIPGEAEWFQVSRPPNTFMPEAVLGAKRTMVDAAGNENNRRPSKKMALNVPMEKEVDDSGAVTHTAKKRDSKTGVLLRVYNEKMAEQLRLTDIVVVYGILEHARLGQQSNLSTIETGSMNDETTKTTSSMSDTPKKFNLPRVHAIVVEKVAYHSLPWLQPREPIDFAVARGHLLALLETVFQGDQIAAQYTLLHLLSTRGSVPAAFPTTMPALNISQRSPELGSIEPIASLLACLLPQMTPMTLSIESLNSDPLFIPVRDAAAGVLEWGLLQLPNGSQVLVDETKLAAGQLMSRGVINCRALTQLATQRTLTYDFQFYQTDWNTDVRCLIISTSPSIIKPTLNVPWQRNSREETKEALNVSASNLWMLRHYLLQVPIRAEGYSIDATLQEVIHNDFVNWRKDASTHIEAEDFAVMLCLLKLHALSLGEVIATVQHWKDVVAMETERRSRLKPV